MSDTRHDSKAVVAVGKRARTVQVVTLLVSIACALLYLAIWGQAQREQGHVNKTMNDQQISGNAQRMLDEGQQTFRFETFGDEVFWSGKLKLHQAIEGAKHGGVGSPQMLSAEQNSALLSVDDEALFEEARRRARLSSAENNRLEEVKLLSGNQTVENPR